MSRPIQVKEFDFSAHKRKVMVEEKQGTKFVDVNDIKTPSTPSASPVHGVPGAKKVYSSNPNITTETKTRTWESDPDWFNGGMHPGKNILEPQTLPKRKVSGNQNIMEIQEKAVADAYAKLMTAKREYLQEKKTLNQLYDVFEVPELKD